jgi:hypothetical protein
VAQDIVQRKADYVLALKDNHPTLHEDVRLWLEDCDTQGHVSPVVIVDVKAGKIGRFEDRVLFVRVVRMIDI